MTDRKHPLDILSLGNPLQPYASFIERLMILLRDGDMGMGQSVDQYVLEVIRDSATATDVIVFRQQQGEWISTGHSGTTLTCDEAESLFAGLLLAAADNSAFGRDYHGLYQAHEQTDTTTMTILIPIGTATAPELMAIGGLPQDSFLLSEVCGRIVTSLYQSTRIAARTAGPLNVAMIEASILDDMKRAYGFVPLSLYNRRFELFCDRLAQMVVYFEPVLRLDPDYLYIDSWEALARNPENDSAPVDLFEAAELWGSKFMIELDSYFLNQAVKSYHIACQASSRRKEDIRELSVNVYPQSLVRRSYFEMVSQIISEKLIQPEKLILEISEKFPLSHPNAGSAESSMEAFRRELGKYVRDLKIGFAIDDFGVGHASVSRLTGLNPAHVKIDRDILHQDQELSAITLSFVLDLASSKHLRAPKVVVEGFDSRSPMSLRQLYELGIRYVQGHMIGKAGPELNRLGKERYDHLMELINAEEQ